MFKIKLPWKIQNHLDLLKIKIIRSMTYRAFTKILDTPPITSHDDAQVEVHSLIDHDFLIYYLMAIKSLAFFSTKKLSIYCHCCKPNMTPEDIAMLRKHIQGVHFIERDKADTQMNEALKKYKTCHKYRTEHEAIIGTSAKFFDQLLISKTNKLILMDADTMFFKTPTEVDDWIDSDGQQSFYLKDKINWFCIPYPKINSIEGMPKVVPLFNAGLLCFDKRSLTENMNRVEEVMALIEANDGDFSGLDQTMYALLLPNQTQLPTSTYSCDINQKVDADANIIFKHYIGRNVRFGNLIYCHEGEAIIKQLMAAD